MKHALCWVATWVNSTANESSAIGMDCSISGKTAPFRVSGNRQKIHSRIILTVHPTVSESLRFGIDLTVSAIDGSALLSTRSECSRTGLWGPLADFCVSPMAVSVCGVIGFCDSSIVGGDSWFFARLIDSGRLFDWGSSSVFSLRCPCCCRFLSASFGEMLVSDCLGGAESGGDLFCVLFFILAMKPRTLLDTFSCERSWSRLRNLAGPAGWRKIRNIHTNSTCQHGALTCDNICKRK